MKIFLSSLETAYTKKIIDMVGPMKWNLMSYYYVKRKNETFNMISDNSEFIMVDSGAHSFQKGIKVNWEEYTKQYAEFIKKHDSPKCIGWFEMDVDPVYGFPFALKLRQIMKEVVGNEIAKKIIPVWHKNRGINNFFEMCNESEGRVVAISGFVKEDIKTEQYLDFLKYAWSCKCKLHCLGMTRQSVLDKVPFDFTDSASWRLQSTYYRRGNIVYNKKWVKANWEKWFSINYKDGIKLQTKYENKWSKYEK